VETEPERFFRPPYVGHRGWIGVDLAVDPDWDEVRRSSSTPTAASPRRPSSGGSTTGSSHRTFQHASVRQRYGYDPRRPELSRGPTRRCAGLPPARTAAATVAGDWTAECRGT
jgi:hypothetical protein